MRLHPKFGVNPTVPTCFFCGESKNEVVLLGAAYKGEAPMHMCIDNTPCEKCEEYMKQGIIFISVRDGSMDASYRTGRFAVVKEEAVNRLFIDGPLKQEVLKKRAVFIEDCNWSTLGLPL